MFCPPGQRKVVLGNFQCRGVPLIRFIGGLGPAVPAVGTEWGCLDDFFMYALSYSFSFSGRRLDIS